MALGEGGRRRLSKCKGRYPGDSGVVELMAGDERGEGMLLPGIDQTLKGGQSNPLVIHWHTPQLGSKKERSSRHPKTRLISKACFTAVYMA